MSFFDTFKEIVPIIAVFVSITAAFISLFILKKHFGKFLNSSFRKVLNKKIPYINVDKLLKIDKTYIELHCEVEDTENKKKIVRENLTKYVNDFIFKDNQHRYLFILGDFGTGKTSFLIKYLIDFVKQGYKKLDINYFNFRDSETTENINKISKKNQNILLLDGLDEDKDIIINTENRISELAEITKSFHKVIITSRLLVFDILKDLENVFVNTSENLKEILITRIAPLNKEQVRDFLKKMRKMPK